MVKKIIVIFLMVAFLSSFVVASDFSASKIRVKTLPGHNVYLSVLDPSVDSSAYSVLHKISDEYGDAFFEYSTNNTNEFNFNLMVKVKKASSQVVPKTGVGVLFEELYVIGDDIYLEALNEGDEIIPTPGLDDIEEAEEVVEEDDVEELVNETEDVALEDLSESSGSWITGNSVVDAVKTPAIYGSVGAVFILGILALFIVGRRRKIKAGLIGGSKKIERKISSNVSLHENELGRAEAKLKAVRAEIERLKGQDKVSEVKKRIAEEQEELRRLREGRI